MKILWSSNAPWAKTGYGQQTALFLPRIKELGHEVACMAWYGLEGGALHWNGITVYPKRKHPFGEDAVAAHAMHFQADIEISLIDAWISEPSMHGKMRWCPWFPVDSEPLPKPVLEKVAQSYQPIVYSKFAVEQCERASISPLYVPHGVNTKLFKPQDKQAARKRFKIPEDAYVIGMVAANKDNPSRKCFTQNLEAFARFKKDHKDAILFLHTDRGEDTGIGVNLPFLVQSLGLEVGKDVLFTEAYAYYMGLSDEQMAALYSAFDVLLAVAMGEGFGVPILEAQACGTPVIVGDWTAMSELLFNGWAIEKKDADPVWTALGAYQYSPRIEAVENGLRRAYLMGSRVAKVPDEVAQYDADYVTETYWKPVLEQLAQRVETNKKLFGGAGADHDHKWAYTGLYIDNRLCQPCLVGKCEAALQDGTSILSNVFPPRIGDVDLDIEDDPDGGVSKFVMYECLHSYHLDQLDLKPGELVIDIGAHVGIVSIYLAKKYSVFVKAFEPVPVNYERLLRNIEVNGVEKLVMPFNMAITKDGRDVFMPNGSKVNSGGNSIYENVDGTPISSMPLCSEKGGIIHPSDKIALLKIDCEGAEYEILEGNYAFLRGIRYVVGELHFNNTTFPIDRMRRLMFGIQSAVGVDNAILSTTPVGDL